MTKKEKRDWLGRVEGDKPWAKLFTFTKPEETPIIRGSELRCTSNSSKTMTVPATDPEPAVITDRVR